MLSPDWKLAWGAEGRASSPQGLASYQLFEVGDRVLGCVAVSQDWGTTSDELGRKGNLACGYFCRDRRSMTAGDAEGISSVSPLDAASEIVRPTFRDSRQTSGGAHHAATRLMRGVESGPPADPAYDSRS